MSETTEKGRVRTFHMTVDIRGGLKLPNRILAGMLVRDDGTRLTAEEAREELLQAFRKGYDVLPTCDNHDEKGHCLGHDKEESEAPAK